MKTKHSALKYVGIAVILVILLFPVYWMVNCSLQRTTVIMTVPPTFFPLRPTFENFAKIFSNASYLNYFKNSFIVAFGTIAVVLIVAIPASFALSRYNFPGKHAIMSAISSVQMFPTVVILITLYGFYNKWGLLDTYRGLILADTTFALPLAITLLKSFYDTVSKSIDEAARIDGANRLQIVWYVNLPTIMPTVMTMLILSCGSVLSVGFEKVYLMQNSLNLSASEVISTYVYEVGVNGAQFSYSSAIGLFNTVVNIVILMLVNALSRRLSSVSIW